MYCKSRDFPSLLPLPKRKKARESEQNYIKTRRAQETGNKCLDSAPQTVIRRGMAEYSNKNPSRTMSCDVSKGDALVCRASRIQRATSYDDMEVRFLLFTVFTAYVPHNNAVSVA